MGVKVRMFEGSWYIFINHRGRRKAKKIGEGAEARRTAEAAAKMIEAKLAMGDLGIVRDEAPVTLESYSADWLAGYVRTNLKSSSYRQYAQIMSQHWVPELGSRGLRDISRVQIRTIITRKMRAGMSASRANTVLLVLQSCLGVAQEEGLISENPVRGHGRWLLKTSSSARGPRRPKLFLASELEAIFRWFASYKPRWYGMVFLLARTGMRIGEACALRVEDVDFERREIHVCRTWSSGLRGDGPAFSPLKSGHDRYVDMSSQLIDVLREHLLAYPPVDGWLFCYERGTPIHPRYFHWEVWRRMFQYYGQILEYRPPHALRHTYASLLINNHVSLAYIKAQLGHASIETTVDIYGHLIRGDTKRAVDQLDDPTDRAEKRKRYASEGILELGVNGRASA
jgi:integrase